MGINYKYEAPELPVYLGFYSFLRPFCHIDSDACPRSGINCGSFTENKPFYNSVFFRKAFVMSENFWFEHM
jgi:hypothetical protein